ncbi:MULTISPECIES: hypothetical protein [unclassified Yoonia]|uniref:hypothetical protein n=1 Tax=unclassified Yoonia TaxID=2629118 RepID=UPI0037280B85
MTKVLIGACALVTIFFATAIGGRIEGYFFPVATPGVIIRYEAVGETSTRIWGDSARLRHCSFDHLVWYLGDEADNARADLVFEEGTKVRPGGRFSFGPWLVQLTPEQLLGRSYAVVYHRCHALWLTETRFYG